MRLRRHAPREESSVRLGDHRDGEAHVPTRAVRPHQEEEIRLHAVPHHHADCASGLEVQSLLLKKEENKNKGRTQIEPKSQNTQKQ
jgi:hypothetical protein